MAPPLIPEPVGTTQIMLRPDGPLLMRGPVQIIDAAGNVVPRTRQTPALCRCGKSRLALFYDTRKLSTAWDGPGPATGSETAKPGRA